MSLSVIGPWTQGGNGNFIGRCPELDASATRVMVQTDDGVCQGWQHSDGRIWAGPLVTPSGAKAAADAAAASARATAQNNENTRSGQFTTALANLDAGTASVAQLNTYLAALGRFVVANVTRTVG